MESSGYRPTDAEAWTYLIQHELHPMLRQPGKVREAIVEVLKGKWDAKVVARINIHGFGIIWSDPRYKRLATKLQSGLAAEAFDIEILTKLKKYRLDGVGYNCVSRCIVQLLIGI